MRADAACWSGYIWLEECTVCFLLVMVCQTNHIASAAADTKRYVLATEGSIRGGAPRPGFVAMAVVSRSGDSNPAEGGGDGIGALGAIREAAASTSKHVELEMIGHATPTMVDYRADMVPHGRDLNIVSTVGAFDCGQEAHVHGRHSGSITIAGAAGGSSRNG